MKILAQGLLLMCLFASCQKTSSSNSSSTQSTFKFQANGKQYEWDGTLTTNLYGSVINAKSIAGVTLYTLSGLDKKGTDYSLLSIDITKGSLNQTTYSYTGTNASTGYATECQFGTVNNFGNNYWNSLASDNTSVTITNIANGYADGNFNASLHGGSMVISNGVFTHVQIVTQ